MSSPQSGLPTDPWQGGEPAPHQPAPFGQPPGYEYAQPYANQPTYPVGYAQPVYPAATPQPVWAPMPPRRSNALVIVLVVLIVLLIGGAGLGYYIYTQNTTTTTDSSTDPTLFRTGDCLVNSGTSSAPQMRKVSCGPGTLLVISKVSDTTNTDVCTTVPGSNFGYYYTNPKFVLCLQEK
jgi:hypothetical protein